MSCRTCPPSPCSLLFFLRTSKGLSQKELSRLCGVNINSICQFELRNAPMTLRNLQRLAAFFGIPLDPLARDDLSYVLCLPSVSHVKSSTIRERLHKALEKMEEVGDAGETFVANEEREKLRGTRYEGKVNIGVADDKKAAFDMLSFDPVSGSPIVVEVKSTCGSGDEDWYISREELDLLHHCIEKNIHYELHRVSRVGTAQVAQAVYTAQEVLDLFTFAPINYVARQKEK